MMADPASINTATQETDPLSKPMLDAMFGAPKPVDEKPRAPDGKFAPAEAKVEPVAIPEAKEEEDAGEPGIDDLAEDEEAPAEALDQDTLSDDTEFDINIDGKPAKVKFKDLKDNYSGEKTIAARIQKATEARQASEARAEELYNIGKAQIERLKALDNVLKTVAAPPQINWDELKAKDPLQYAIKREEYREWQDRQAQVQGEIRRVNEEQAGLQAQAQDHYLEEQATQLVAKLPVFADPDKGQALMGQLTKAAKAYYDFSPEEVAKVLDHRQLLVLNDAVKYRALLAKKAAVGAKVTTPVSNVRPMKVTGNKSAAPAQTKSKQDAVLNQARKSGSVDDIALTLLVPAKQQARR